MISFIVPVRNEVQFTSKTIQSLLNQKTKIDFEILIADGLSIDGTREIIKNLNKGTSIALMIDQRVREGVKVPFFKHLATTTSIPAQLIKKYNCDWYQSILKEIN